MAKKAVKKSVASIAKDIVREAGVSEAVINSVQRHKDEIARNREAAKTGLAAFVAGAKDKEIAVREKALGSEWNNVLVRARAGCGKTVTQILGLAWKFKTCRMMVNSKMGFNFEPSSQQAAIWEEMGKGQYRDVLYVAFNKSIVEEFESKWSWLVQSLRMEGVNLYFSTIHSLGYKACQQAYKLPWKAVNKYKTWNMIEEFTGKPCKEIMAQQSGRVFVSAAAELTGKVKLEMAHEVIDAETYKAKRRAWASLAGVAPDSLGEVNDRMTYLDVDADRLAELAVRYEIDMNGSKDKIFGLVPLLVNRSRISLKEVDFNDQIWLPSVNNLGTQKYDFLLVDEAQDLNKCQQTLLSGVSNRMLACGDDKQAIYGFAGADTESLNNVGKMIADKAASVGKGFVELPLTVTRRCSKAVVRVAQKYAPDFEAHESNSEGAVRRAKILDSGVWEGIAPRDMILCRVNAPLLGLAFRFIREGRKANIKGRDIGDNLKLLVKKSKTNNVPDLVEWLDKYQDTEIEKLERMKRPQDEAIIAIKDKVECLKMFCEGEFTIQDVDRQIDAMFTDTATTGILLSSIHKAKGLEANCVYIYRPELIPHPAAKTLLARQQEENLAFVATTRAIDTLVYLEDK